MCDVPCTLPVLVRRIGILIANVVFGRMPAVPLAARWMRILTTLQFFKLCFAMHAIGLRVVLRALDPAFVAKIVKDNVIDAGYVDRDLTNNTDRDRFHQALGKRLRRSVEFLASKTAPRDIDALILGLLPLNYMQAYMLNVNRQRASSPTSAPVPVLDLTNDKYSALTVARQAYADIILTVQLYLIS